MRRVLYQFKDEEISVIVEAYFESGNLVVEGYDIGKRVEDFWGDSDYEYSSTVAAEQLDKLYDLFQVPREEEALLSALANRFNGNACYSSFQSFLDENQVKYTGFSWT
jgi:hypothetical protein